MRLIIISILFALLSSLSVGKLACQTQIDTINLAETFLEERHLRYIYNFALNAYFFQYGGGTRPLSYRSSMDSDSNLFNGIFIIKNDYPIRNWKLRAFTKQDSLPVGKVLKNKSYDLENIGLYSQFDFIFLVADDQKDISNYVQEQMKGIPEISYAVQFSNFFVTGNKIYLSIRMHYFIDPLFSKTFTRFRLFEFEWCERMGWVYPRRVSNSSIDLYSLTRSRSKYTIDIPSLKCN